MYSPKTKLIVKFFLYIFIYKEQIKHRYMFNRNQYNEVLANWPEGQGGVPEFDVIR
jgi:hypothetical protein